MEKRREMFSAWSEVEPDKARAWASEYPDDFDSLAGEDSDLLQWATANAFAFRCKKTPDLFGGIA